MSAAAIHVSITALGSLDGRTPVLRSGARVGDSLYAAGLLGWSAAGLALLERGDAVLIDRHADLVDAHRVPRPPYGYGAAAAEAGATSMIDVSDGLLADLGHVLDASGLGADLDSGALSDGRLDAAAGDLGTSAADWSMRGGEDHALLFTVPASKAAPTHPLLRRLGVISAARGIRVDGAPVAAEGFNHFGASS